MQTDTQPQPATGQVRTSSIATKAGRTLWISALRCPSRKGVSRSGKRVPAAAASTTVAPRTHGPAPPVKARITASRRNREAAMSRG